MCANYKYLPTNTATVKGPEQTSHNNGLVSYVSEI